MRGAARAAAAVAALAAASVAGCGLGPGRGTGGVDLNVTRDFGQARVGAARAARAPGSETVMRFLQRSFSVQTRYGGGFVQAIDGLAGGVQGGRRIDWFYYVNGIEADRGAAAFQLHRGDRVWWDRHDWTATPRVPAVVGSFPEPFVHGTEGRRLPVRLQCAPDASGACDAVASKLVRLGVVVGRASLGTQPEANTLRVLVGPWREVRDDPAARRLEGGPAASGVYVRFAAGGSRLVLLDAAGVARRRLGPRSGAGLIAATRLSDQPPTWLVTGLDAGGVGAAAGAFDESTLRDRFALATAAGGVLSLPLGAGA